MNLYDKLVNEIVAKSTEIKNELVEYRNVMNSSVPGSDEYNTAMRHLSNKTGQAESMLWVYGLLLGYSDKLSNIEED